MKRWITADWHLGEDRMAIMCRPFKSQRDHVERLVEIHNSLVSPDDLVYVVGDVCYQKTPEFLPEVSRMNGNKVLLRGNHDRIFNDDQLKEYFQQIVPEGKGLEIDVKGIKCYLTHYPSCASSDRFNLVGHIHSAWKFQLNMVNVGVDANHFTPHDLDESIPFFYTAINEYYDDDVWVAYNKINSDYVGQRGKKGVYFSL